MAHRPAIEASGLEKSYGAVKVLRGVDLSVAPGSVFALLGPNGAGKTTTVRILATLTPPDAGRARVAGLDVVAERRRVRRVISLTGQYAAVDEMQTGEENLRMMGRLTRLGRAEARGRAQELLERFDLTGAARRTVGTYSGGMRRRLDLAAGLVGHPEVIFLDEPTTGLDPRSRQA
ncbi:ATP-binding cassette domain-containing protein, partial [Streptomyces albiflaviniger]|nr:ATP-binding cassette domain-containing protein [Streptomyces albiflaviniger]